MKYILCYGDSNTWGASPDQQPRFAFDERWTGVLQRMLGETAHVYENALVGRTTGLEDFVEPGRNGRAGFSLALEQNAPLDLVILMLGTNDCKKRFSCHPAWDAALGVRSLVQTAQNALYGQGKAPRVLVIAPPHMKNSWAQSWVAEEFDEASAAKAARLAPFYRRVAEESGAAFLDAAGVAEVGADCVHITRQAHASLGRAVAAEAARLLGLKREAEAAT